MTETYVDPTRETFRTFRSLKSQGPIHMLNLVRLREIARYPAGHAQRSESLTGLEAYRSYGRESHPVFTAVGGEVRILLPKGNFLLAVSLPL